MGKITPTQRVVNVARRHGAPILTHRQWGSKELATYAVRTRLTQEGKWPGFLTKVDTVVLHITVTPDTGNFKFDCQLVEKIGKERFNSGVSYNWLVSMKYGTGAVGQPMNSKGTHTVNDKNVPGFSHDQNLKARAIACVGMPGDKLSDAALETIVDIMFAMWKTDQLTEDPDVLPHSFFAAKDCPTDAVRSKIPEIKRRYKARIDRALGRKS